MLLSRTQPKRFDGSWSRVAVLVAFCGAVLCAGCASPDSAMPGAATEVPAPEEVAAVQTIDAEEAQSLITSNETVVLDVRTPEEYAERHIPNARLLTLDTIDEATAAAVAPAKDEPVLVYCRTGVRSAEAARKLAALGYTQVYDFGGIVDWPYATVEGDEAAAECGLPEGEMPVGVKVVCGKTRSLPGE